MIQVVASHFIGSGTKPLKEIPPASERTLRLTGVPAPGGLPHTQSNWPAATLERERAAANSALVASPLPPEAACKEVVSVASVSARMIESEAKATTNSFIGAVFVIFKTVAVAVALGLEMTLSTSPCARSCETT